MSEQIQYRGGYKYSLWETYRVQVRIIGHEVDHRLFNLTESGLLTIFEDYPWDGASGPTIDTKSSIRGSLVHDALYEMIRLGLLPESIRVLADEELRDICIADGMWKWRADRWFDMVERFGGAHSAVAPVAILTAP